MDFSKSLSLVERFHSLIPGGSHTYAKGDDQYPAHMMPYVARGEGCRMWDADGNEFIEWGMGLRAVGLGHAYPSVIEAARKGRSGKGDAAAEKRSETEDRFEEWHRLAHAKDEVESWAPKPE